MRTILAIDDQQNNLITIKAVIENNLKDCKVLTALSGKEGIEIAIKELPDMILLDIVMPRMDGFEACKRLKQEELTKHIPVVMITAVKVDKISRVKGLETGADAFLSKPIDPDELAAQVNVMLRIKKAEDKLRTDKERLNQKVQERTKELKESEEKYRSIFEGANDGMLHFDENLVVLEINTVFTEITGVPTDAVVGKTAIYLAKRYVNKNQLPEIQDILNNLIVRHRGKTYDLHIKDKVLEISLRKQENGQSVGIIRDVTDRKRTEEELKKLSTAVQQSPSVVVIADLMGNLEYVNPKYNELTGYSSKEVISNKAKLLKFGEQSKDFYQTFWNTISSGKVWRGEYQFKKKNGDLFWEAAAVSPIFDMQGNITNYIKVAEDITERKQAVVALKLSEEKYRKLIETTAEGFWQINLERKTIDVNQSLCDLLGYSREEIIGKTPFEFVDHINNKIFEEQIASSKSGKQRIYEISLKRSDGTNIPTLFNATSLNDKEGKFAGSFAFVSNISKRKHAEQIQKVLYNISNAVTTSDNLNKLISQIQKELGTIINTTNFYIALYEPETDTLSLPFFNDEKDKFTSFPAGKTLTKYVIRTHKSLLANKEKLKELIESGEVEIFGTISEVWLGVPLKIEGMVTGVLAVQSYTDENAYDRSDLKMLEFVSDQVSLSIHRKKAEDELIQALQKAEESDRLKSAFLTNMSHEIRTPMNGILGFASLLKEPGLSGDEQQAYIKIIEKSGIRMLNTINNLMDISKIEAGQMNLSITKTNVSELLEDIYNFFKPEVEHKGIQLVMKNTLSTDECIIKTDREKLYSILTNLVKNAIKYTQEGVITVGCSAKGKDLEFFVRDTGIGIPKSRQLAVFDRFVQADIEDRAAYQGTGLGLTISKAYVEMLNGKIWVESGVANLPAGKAGGSIFYFKIPRNIDSNESIPFAKGATPLKETEMPLKKLKVLIVEDDEFADTLLTIVIKEISYETIHASNGVEAIKLCQQNPDIDLVLMDIKMPKVSGYEATRRIRKFNKEIVIIAQTAFGLVGDREKAIEAGCNDYISKPININELMNMIAFYLR